MKELHGTYQRTLAYINLYGVLGSLEELCALDEEARDLIADQDIRVGSMMRCGNMLRGIPSSSSISSDQSLRS